MNQLIEGLKNKEQKAFREIYKMFSIQMYNTALRIVGTEIDAEDILQEVFIKVFQNIGNLEKSELFPAWIKRITINTSLEYIQKKKKCRVEELIDVKEYNDTNDGIDETTFALQVEDIQKAVFKLPDIYRMVFTLHCMEDLSHEEIAKQLNIPPSTIRSQYSRARKKIYELISKEQKHERQFKRLYTVASLTV